ncbi:MAG: hypothetical protein E6K92_06380 [Thaumarchaeota archaeon]|nr:MAG: hypothetical protein E6K92_06380 [Nitrososphaerota archaeon]
MIGPSIQMLELAIGIKDSLIAAGFTSLDSLLRSNPTDIAAMLGIELYVAKLIIDAAKRASGQHKVEEANTIDLPSE